MAIKKEILGCTIVGKSRQMSEESDLTWDLCCKVDTRRESTWTRDSAVYQGFGPSLSRGKDLLLLLIIAGVDSSIRGVDLSITMVDRNLRFEEIKIVLRFV